ncbi:MAG TPA: SapC family protein [Stellaceae bacterium]|nr:SapC family protein [Stellaceae bacterium]
MAPKGGSTSPSAGDGTAPVGPASSGPSTEASGAPPADPRFPLFYRSLTPIDAARHASKSLKRRIGFDFARSSHAVLLNGSEFEAAARHYPIVFTPAPAAAALVVMGVRRERNFFVDNAGDWRPGTYIPAYIRRYPFIFHESADKQQYTLCIDETSGAIEDGNDRPLFSGGKPTPIVQDALKFCAAFQRDYASTREFAEQLSERGLLIPNQAEITLNSGEKLAVTGFHIIDRDRFAGLPDSAFLEWRRKGWLPWVFGHFVSHANWSALVDLAGAAAKAA